MFKLDCDSLIFRVVSDLLTLLYVMSEFFLSYSILTSLKHLKISLVKYKLRCRNNLSKIIKHL